jgi:predicted CXXCH cytochrome family protein
MILIRLIKIVFLCGCGVIATGRFLLITSTAAQTASYVGNAACVRCHEAIARNYAATPMAQSSGAARADFTEASFTHQPSGVRYRMRNEGGKAFLEYERAGIAALKGKQELHFYIGSNAAGRSYLFSLERFLFLSPVTYYSQTKRWGVSPGYESDQEMQLNRPIKANCLFCHASQLQPIYGTQNRFADPPFKHAGVSCERCHGPGSLHIEGKAKLVNPAKLDPARRDSICAQCHLSGEARVELPGKRLAQFRPGDLLADYVSFFVFAGTAQAGLKVNSHVENLAESRCKQQNGERLSCLNCHDPHAVPKPQARAAWFRNRCLQCHQAARLPDTHNPTADCTSCHMPSSQAVDGGHGVMTDHRILKLSRKRTEMAGAARRLVPFPGFTADERLLGLAYAEVALVSGDQLHQAEALRLLTAALKVRPETSDAELFARLGFLYQQRGDLLRAGRAYESALQIDRYRTDALVNLGGIYAAQGKIEQAAALWRDALEGNIGLTEATLNLAQVYRAQGRLPQAREVLQQALRFHPDSGQARRLSKEVESGLGKHHR